MNLLSVECFLVALVLVPRARNEMVLRYAMAPFYLNLTRAGRKLRSMRYVAAKALELIGMLVVLAALLAGLGLTQDGQASMGKEMLLLGIGGMVFTFGWLLERGTQA